jgi:LPXTG-motif cell wall-anchored protein
LECYKRYALQPNSFLAFLLILLFLDIVITTGPSTLPTTSPPITTSSPQIIAPPATTSTASPSTGLPTGAIIGIAIGIVVLAVASFFLYVYRRRRRRPDTGGHPQPINGISPVVEVESNTRRPSELHGETSHDGPHQMDASSDVASFYSAND